MKRFCLLPALILAVACERSAIVPAETVPMPIIEDRPDMVLARATPTERDVFDAGDALFETTMRAADGLGPHFLQKSCASCHKDDGRGPAVVPKRTAAGVTTNRMPPPVFGRGYIEAVADEEIEALEQKAAHRTNGIKGRIHRVASASELNDANHARVLIGRFGIKARLATLDDFAADALLNDMGLTSPLRPQEPQVAGEGRADVQDGKPGIDMSLEHVRQLADYTRLLEIPTRAPADPQGKALFVQCSCATCHVPSLKTRPNYPVAALAGIEAPIFTDLLLHDMGQALADDVPEGHASGREYRTAPLIGLRFLPSFLHDGRASSVAAAIAAHDGTDSEARVAAAAVAGLSPDERQTLFRYVESL